MSYTGNFVGQLLHPNVNRDVIELAKAVMPDHAPWPEGTTFEEKDNIITVSVPKGNTYVMSKDRVNREEREYTILAHVNPVTGEVFATNNDTSWDHVNNRAVPPTFAGRLEGLLTYFPRTWAEADMLVMANETWGKCLWYAGDAIIFLAQTQAALYDETRESRPTSSREYFCPIRKKVVEVPTRIQYLIGRLSSVDRLRRSDLDELDLWLREQAASVLGAFGEVTLLSWVGGALDRARKVQVT